MSERFYSVSLSKPAQRWGTEDKFFKAVPEVVGEASRRRGKDYEIYKGLSPDSLIIRCDSSIAPEIEKVRTRTSRTSKKRSPFTNLLLIRQYRGPIKNLELVV